MLKVYQKFISNFITICFIINILDFSGIFCYLMPVYHFEFESYNLSHYQILSHMKNITKLKSPSKNRSNPFKLSF